MSPVSGILEFVKDAIFDTAFVPENLYNGKCSLFVIPLGCYAGRNIKGYEHTNMLQAGCLDAPKKFLIKSFHCGLFESGNFVPSTHRVWDARFVLESMGEHIIESPLREIADQSIRELIRRGRREQKDCNIQEIVSPLTDTAEFEKQIQISAAYYDARSREWLNQTHHSARQVEPELPKPSGMLLEQQQCFHGRIEFDHPINVPIDVIVAMNGILARAVM